jgi:hypothetical protein
MEEQRHGTHYCTPSLIPNFAPNILIIFFKWFDKILIIIMHSWLLAAPLGLMDKY